MAQRFAVNVDVHRGEQVNRSSSAVVFDVEHGLRRFLSVCREQAQGSQEIWLEKSTTSNSKSCVRFDVQMLYSNDCAGRTLLPLISIKTLGDKVQRLKNDPRKRNEVKTCFQHQSEGTSHPPVLTEIKAAKCCSFSCVHHRCSASNPSCFSLCV